MKKILEDKKINVIAVKDKNDVLKAAELFEKIGVKVFSSKELKDKFIKTGDNVKNNFLIYGNDGWRVQSHFITDGTSVEKLEEIINSDSNLMNKFLLQIYKKNIKDIEKEFKKIKIGFDNIQDIFTTLNQK